MKNKLIISVACMGAVVFLAFAVGATPDNGKDENRFCDSGTTVARSETILYHHKETTYSYDMPTRVPAYLPAAGIVNSCANIAGATIIGFYDRFCEQLIPDYTTYYTFGTAVVYNSSTTSTIANVMTNLFTLMETNVNAEGTTFNGYQKGMAAYSQNHGYTYSSETVMTNRSFDLDKYRASITNGKPVSLFLSTYSFYYKDEEIDGGEIFYYRYSNIGHVVVGYGYFIETFYNSYNQVVATRTYLHVAGGQVGSQNCYLCLDGKSTVDEAISATIK